MKKTRIISETELLINLYNKQCVYIDGVEFFTASSVIAAINETKDYEPGVVYDEAWYANKIAESERIYDI